MKKTGFVWFVIIIGTLNFLFVLFLLFNELTGVNEIQFMGSTTLKVFGVAINVVGLAISAIYIYKLCKMKSDALKWTNISFGYSVFTLIFSSFSIATSTGKLISAISSNSLSIIVIIVLWVLFYRHLKKIMLKSV